MTECPHCDKLIRDADKFAIGLKGKAKKSHMSKARNKYKGDFIYKHYGFKGTDPAPKNAMSVDICKSCGWTSINRKDGEPVELNSGKMVIPWRNMKTGVNIDWKEVVRRNGW